MIFHVINVLVLGFLSNYVLDSYFNQQKRDKISNMPFKVFLGNVCYWLANSFFMGFIYALIYLAISFYK